MSNVLIGIIGVILFIGLALAGALFLGPRFQQATTNSKAAKVVSDMQQVSAAINMARVQEGASMQATNYATNVSTLVPTYLKAEPTVPTSGLKYEAVDQDGGNRAMPVHHLQAVVGLDTDPVAQSVCRTINVNAGYADPDAAMSPAFDGATWGAKVRGGRTFGCFLFGPGKTYYAYMVI